MPTWSIGGALVLLGSVLCGPEREAERLQQRATLLVVLRGGHDGDVEATDAVDLVLVDLVEHRLLVETESVVSVAVELLVAQTAEVTDTRKRERDQAVEELPGAVAAKRDVCTDRLALAQLELRDRLACGGDLRLLAGDRGEVLDRAVDDLAIASCLADTRVHDDLHDAGHLVHVRELEVLLQLCRNLVTVLQLQARLDFASYCCVSHYRSLPDFLA